MFPQSQISISNSDAQSGNANLPVGDDILPRANAIVFFAWKKSGETFYRIFAKLPSGEVHELTSESVNSNNTLHLRPL